MRYLGNILVTGTKLYTREIIGNGEKVDDFIWREHTVNFIDGNSCSFETEVGFSEGIIWHNEAKLSMLGFRFNNNERFPARHIFGSYKDLDLRD